MGEIIDCGKANIIKLTWDINTGKPPKKGQLLQSVVGHYFKVMEVNGKKVTLLQIQ